MITETDAELRDRFKNGRVQPWQDGQEPSAKANAVPYATLDAMIKDVEENERYFNDVYNRERLKGLEKQVIEEQRKSLDLMERRLAAMHARIEQQDTEIASLKSQLQEMTDYLTADLKRLQEFGKQVDEVCKDADV